MYQIWFSYYGECVALAVWGLLLVLVRKILMEGLYRDAALENGGKGRLLRQMTLKYEKSYELKVGIPDRETFVRKYLCQQKRLGIRLGRWRRLPERWCRLILCIGVLETVAMSFMGHRAGTCLNRMVAATAAAALVQAAILWFETDSLWELSWICLQDYISNTLYPRQFHDYESFPEDSQEEQKEAEKEEPAVPAAPKEHRHCRYGRGPCQCHRRPGGLPGDCCSHQCGLWGILWGHFRPSEYAQFLRQRCQCGEY